MVRTRVFLLFASCATWILSGCDSFPAVHDCGGNIRKIVAFEATGLPGFQKAEVQASKSTPAFLLIQADIEKFDAAEDANLCFVVREGQAVGLDNFLAVGGIRFPRGSTSGAYLLEVRYDQGKACISPYPGPPPGLPPAIARRLHGCDPDEEPELYAQVFEYSAADEQMNLQSRSTNTVQFHFN